MARKIIREISLNGKKYFSLNFASSLCGYHKDYLGQLIRRGELEGEKIKEVWFIEKNVFTRFCDKTGILLSNFSSTPSDPWDRLLLGEKDIHQKEPQKEFPALNLQNILNLQNRVFNESSSLSKTSPRLVKTNSLSLSLSNFQNRGF
jgi:hypothetical protein